MKDTVTYPLSAIMDEDEESRIDQLERELAAIKSQPVPVEPEYPSPQYAQIIQFEGCPSVVISPETYEEITAYIDTLKQQLQVAQQERDGYLDLNRDCAELAEAKAEIERLKKRRDECSNGWDGEIATGQRLRRELAEAVAKERERCARVCEEILHPDDSAKIEEKANWYAGTWACAAAIGKGE